METNDTKKLAIVAGGAGFIGSHLCEELLKTSRVICVDNFSTGSEENVHHLLSNPDFKFIRHDVSTPLDLDAFPELRMFRIAVNGVQEVYNLACPTSPTHYQQYQVETLLANALGTKHLLDLAVQYKAKLLHLSSSSIYGEPLENTPFPEEYWGFVDPIGPRSCYTEGKRFAESLVVNYQLRYQIEAKILRVFNTYGPRMQLSDGRMLPDFIGAALHNEELMIYGDPTSLSTFNYISDLIEAMQKMMASNETGPFNVGSPETHVIHDVAKMVVQMTESTSQITFHDQLPHTAKQGVADITRIRERLGWFPVVPLEDGLRRTVESLKATQVLRYKAPS